MSKFKLVKPVFKHLDNPFIFLVSYCLNRSCLIRLKNGTTVNYDPGDGTIHKLIQILEKGFRILNQGDDLLINSGDGIRFLQPDLGCLNEDFSAMYLNVIDVQGKCVYDIGGFFGETALYFSIIGGARKVFVFEPIAENCTIIRKNVDLNDAQNISCMEKGLSDSEGTIKISSGKPPGSSAFGAPGSKYAVEISVIPWDNVLSEAVENSAYLVKSDCEGAEKFLVDADKKLISSIENFIIEIHNNTIEENLDQLFSEIGYEVELVKRVTSEISIKKYFRR